MHGQWAIGPQYLLRILVLVLWGGNPWKFASLSDLWAVDWPRRSVEWTKRRQHECLPHVRGLLLHYAEHQRIDRQLAALELAVQLPSTSGPRCSDPSGSLELSWIVSLTMSTSWR